ncbi:MAG: molecular chaperone DnaJ, partial [Armatimonadota bacterium]|nr:molecular chaperone DnaJ [Armatimonadota bacterium]
EGARVRVANQGAEGSGGGLKGDLYLTIHVQPHPFWKREGDDLHCEVPVTFGEAALGATIDVPTINGPVQMKIPAGTQCGQTFRLSGRGVPHVKGGGAGDQYVKVKVAVPKHLGPREEELIKELSRLRDQNVRLGLPTNL